MSMPASILSELMRKQAEIPWQFELKLVRRRAPGKFEPVDVPTPPREVRRRFFSGGGGGAGSVSSPWVSVLQRL